MALLVMACGPTDETPIDDGEPQQPVEATIEAEFIGNYVGPDPYRPGLYRYEMYFDVSITPENDDPYFLRNHRWFIRTDGKPIQGHEIKDFRVCEAEETHLLQGEPIASIQVGCFGIFEVFEADVMVGYHTDNGTTASEPFYIKTIVTPKPDDWTGG